MKTNKYTYLSYLILCVWIAFTACTDDTFVHDSGTFDYNSITLKVNMPTPVVCNPMTRAGAEDFNKMNDLNVVFAKGGDDNSAIKSIYYISLDGTTADDGVSYSNEQNDASGNITAFSLHFTSDWLKTNNLSANEGKFYLVANWGSEINVGTVGDLKDLKAGSVEIGGTEGWIIAPNVMFGEAVDNSNQGLHPEGDTNTLCRVLNVGLERTAAMITLVMNGERLGKGIVITPTKVSLHNVPKECTIGNQNIVTTVLGGTEVSEGAVSPDGEYKDGKVWSGNVSLVGTETLEMLNFSDPNRFNTSIGEHYITKSSNGEGTVTIDNPSATTVQPLFLYENMHGANFGANTNDQKHKRPNGVNPNKEDIENAAVTKSCSYLMVTANYYQYDENNGSLKTSGTISWRFFLGNDAIKDFDVERNKYYKIGLTLSGTAITELNSTWRVDGEVSDLAIVGDDDIVLGGGGEMFCVTLLAADAKKNLHVSYSGYSGFIYVESEKKAGTWISLTDGSSLTPGVIKIDQNETTGLFEVWFYVQPMISDVTWFEENNHKRNGAITFQPSGSSSVSLSVTQYEPIRIDITAADVSDPNDKDMQEIKNLITTYYNYDFNNENPFTIYLDRIDRDPMPWGFDGQEIDHNQTSGFENVYHLIDKNATDPVCVSHREYAKRYLPTGKSYHNISSADLDYTRGSCMMHAAFMNDFQKYYDENTLNGVKTEDLVQTVNLPDRPTNSSVDGLTFQWCVPSIVGWQLLEKLDRYFKNEGKGGIFDPDYPIIPFYSYWTSNAGATNLPEDVYPDADGKTNSFVYEFGVGLDAITEEHPYGAQYLRNRSLPLRYRLINIDPGLPKDGGGEEPDPME